MKRYIILFVMGIGLLTATAWAVVSASAADNASAAKPQIADTGWLKRCDAKDKKKCEVFQELVEAKSKSRVIEFAVSAQTAKGSSGVVILPLGILLEKGVGMQIDGGKAYAFAVRYCTNAGCFGYINLSKDLLAEMKKAQMAKFIFQAANGRNVNMLVSLKGFGKAFDSL